MTGDEKISVKVDDPLYNGYAHRLGITARCKRDAVMPACSRQCTEFRDLMAVQELLVILVLVLLVDRSLEISRFQISTFSNTTRIQAIAVDTNDLVQARPRLTCINLLIKHRVSLMIRRQNIIVHSQVSSYLMRFPCVCAIIPMLGGTAPVSPLSLHVKILQHMKHVSTLVTQIMQVTWTEVRIAACPSHYLRFGSPRFVVCIFLVSSESRTEVARQ